MSTLITITRAFPVVSCLLVLPAIHGCKEKKEEQKVCECTSGMTETCATPCGTEGLLACNLDCTWSDCMIPPEQCNGLDDDCDGEVDEAFQCTPGEIEACVTSCASEGTATCNVRCRVGPCIAVETCNGVDDDCDGNIDEGFECALEESEGCVTSCGTEGMRICGALCTWGSCELPIESCNGLDDDCDGNIDDSFECVLGEAETCITYCGTEGTRNCGELCAWGPCWPPTEICNDIDDDCDGSIDENYGKTGSDVRITNASGYSRVPFLVYTGSEYGVSWGDTRDGESEIYFARISSSGVKEGDDVRLTDAAETSWYPSLAYTGSEYGVSWYDGRDGNDEIYFTRISSSGVKVGSDVRITNASGDSLLPSLVYAGSEYGVSWHDDRDGNQEIYFARISSSGVKVGDDVRLTNAVGASHSSSLVFTGIEYGVSWYDDRDGNDEIYFARISSSGVKVGSDVRITNAAGDSQVPSLIYTGSDYGLSWDDDRDGNDEIYFARISSSGMKVGSDVRITNDSSASQLPSLVYAGSDYGVSWFDSRDSSHEIYFARISSSGVKVESDVRITNAAGDSQLPFLVYTGSEYAVSWNDSRDGNDEIYFARIDCI